MSQDLISVIIPVYNVEKYLDRCISSIVNQTYDNLDIILVDDGSTDNSGAICDKYAENDSRIRVIHKKNGGLSDARNAGLEICKGDYISFIDSDDYVTINYIDYMYKLLKKYNADFVDTEFVLVFENSKTDVSAGYSIKEKVYNKKEAIKDLTELNNIKMSACGKLYRSDIFDKIRFPKGKIYEDLAVMYDIIMLSNSIVWSDAVLYKYFMRKNSITQSEYTPKNYMEIQIIDELMDKVIEEYPEFEIETYIRRVFSYTKILHRILNSSQRSLYKKEQNDIINMVKKYAPYILKSKKADRNIKIKIISLYMGRYIFLTVKNVSDCIKCFKAGGKYVV